MKCTLLIWRSWLWTSVGSNLGCVVLMTKSYLIQKYVCWTFQPVTLSFSSHICSSICFFLSAISNLPVISKILHLFYCSLQDCDKPFVLLHCMSNHCFTLPKMSHYSAIAWFCKLYSALIKICVFCYEQNTRKQVVNVPNELDKSLS